MCSYIDRVTIKYPTENFIPVEHEIFVLFCSIAYSLLRKGVQYFLTFS